MNWMHNKNEDLFCTVSSEALQRHRAMLSEEVIRPASELHTNLRSSVHRYVFNSEELPSLRGGENEVHEDWIPRALGKWQDMKIAEQDFRPICSLYPSILRVADGIGAARTICAPTVVVSFTGAFGSGHRSPAEPNETPPPHSGNSSAGTKVKGWERSLHAEDEQTQPRRMRRPETTLDRTDRESASSRPERSFYPGSWWPFGQSSRSHTTP